MIAVLNITDGRSGQNCCVRMPVLFQKDIATLNDFLYYMLKYINLQVTRILATNMLVKNVTIQTGTERKISWP